jgi:hypothetical protein
MKRVHYVLAVTAGLIMSGAAAQGLPPAPEARQFDFWIGDWDVHVRQRVARDKDEWQEGEATNKITSSFSGRVIEEHFDGARLPQPNVGMSVSVYNPHLHQWQQTWVDDQGNYLDFVGAFADGKMVLNHVAQRQGKKILFRMVFEDIARDSLTWKWERSRDDGKTWLLLLEERYTRRKPDSRKGDRQAPFHTVLVKEDAQ